MDYTHLPAYDDAPAVFLNRYASSPPATRDTSPWSDAPYFMRYSSPPTSPSASISANGLVNAWPLASPVDPKTALLTQACISLTFGHPTAETYLAHLLGVTSQSDWNVSLGIDEHPGAYRAALEGRTRTIDYNVGSVRGEGALVPQRLWRPSSDLDHIRLVNNARLESPIWFDFFTGGVGISLADAVDGNCAELRDRDTGISMNGKATTMIRLWIDGHPKMESQIHIRDDTPAKAPVTRDRLACQVGRAVEKIYKVLGLPSDPDARHSLLILGIVQVSMGGWQPLLFKRAHPEENAARGLAMPVYGT